MNITTISVRTAALTMIILLGFVCLFHLAVLAGMVPADIVWGGKIKDKSQLVTMEMISLLINLVVIPIIAMRADFIKALLPFTVIRIILWLLVVLFSLNTIGNLFAESIIETLLFTPLTLISALLCYRLSKSD